MIKSITNYKAYQGPGSFQQLDDYRKSNNSFEQDVSSRAADEALRGQQ